MLDWSRVSFVKCQDKCSLWKWWCQFQIYKRCNFLCSQYLLWSMDLKALRIWVSGMKYKSMSHLGALLHITNLAILAHSVRVSIHTLLCKVLYFQHACFCTHQQRTRFLLWLGDIGFCLWLQSIIVATIGFIGENITTSRNLQSSTLFYTKPFIISSKLLWNHVFLW